MVGWWASGKPHPNRTNAVFMLSLRAFLPDGADGAATGQRSRRSHVKAAFTGSPCHSPVAAKSLSVHVWNDPAVRARHHCLSREPCG